MIPRQIKFKPDKKLAVSWDDGHESVISLPSLRHNCPCARCQGETVLLHHYSAPPQDQSPPVSAVLPAALILSIVGWVGLAALFFLTVPTVGPRWSFFFLAVLAVTGLALPLMAFINRRFPSTPPVNTGVILREAIWVGIFFPTLAWLQIGRAQKTAISYYRTHIQK